MFFQLHLVHKKGGSHRLTQEIFLHDYLVINNAYDFNIFLIVKPHEAILEHMVRLLAVL